MSGPRPAMIDHALNMLQVICKGLELAGMPEEAGTRPINLPEGITPPLAAAYISLHCAIRGMEEHQALMVKEAAEAKK